MIPVELRDQIGRYLDFNAAYTINCSDGLLISLNGINAKYHFNSLSWLLQHYNIQDFKVEHALHDVNVLKVLHGMGLNLTPGDFTLALELDSDLTILQYFNNCGIKPMQSAIAAKCGNMVTLEWLNQVNLLSDPLVVENAVLSGKLEVVKWAIKNGFEPTAQAYAVCVHLDNGIADFLISIGTPINYRAMVNAITYSQPEKVFWLYGHGCLLHEEVLFAAILSNNLSLVCWLIYHGCPTTHVFEIALAHENIEILKYLISVGVTSTNIEYCFILAVRYCELSTLEWTYRYFNVVPPSEVIDTAILMNKSGQIEFLLSINCHPTEELRPLLVGTRDFDLLA